MHWHENLQFIYVWNGTIEVRTLESTVQIYKGEGVFINKVVIHYVRQLENCHYNSFLFPAYFLEFYAEGPAKELVDSMTANDSLPFVHFSSDVEA